MHFRGLRVWFFQLASSYLFFIIHLSAGAAGVNFFYMKKNKKSVLDIDATNKMSASTRNRILYGNSLGVRWKGDEEDDEKRTFGEFLSDIGENILKFILILMIFNPIFFWLWALILPSWMADCLDSRFFLRKKIGRAIRKADIWEIAHLLPMKHRFIAMEVLDPKEFPIRLQVLYFNTKVVHEKEPWEIYQYSPEALKKLWTENIGKAREELLAKGVSLDDEQLLELIKEYRFDTLSKYMERHTISNTVMKALYNSAYRREYQPLFLNQIAKSGASPEILAIIKKEDEPALKKALSEFSQLAIVRKSADKKDKDLFLSLVRNEGLCPRAQKELTLWQYCHLPYRGKKLEEEVILQKANPKNHDWKEWVKAFKEAKVLDFPKWEIFMLNNPEVRIFIMNPPLPYGEV